MRRIQGSSEDEMIALFLRAELSSSRYGDQVGEQLRRAGLDRRIILEPDLADDWENAQRRAILRAYRDYGNNTGLFDGFPTSVRWERATLSAVELARVKYIDYDYWVELSGGSRLAVDAARRINAGITVFGVSNDGFVALAKAVAAGVKLPELIVVTATDESDLVVLEGHVRLTAYFLSAGGPPPEVEVLIGYSPDFIHWGLYQ